MGKSKKTSAPSAPAPLPLGNEFQFWVPKGGGGKPPLPPPPPPAPAAAPAAGAPTSATLSTSTKATTDTPMEYVTTHFTPAKTVPFGSGASIDTEYVHVTPALLLAAAVECGYGPQAYWTSKLLMSPFERSELANHLLLRLDWIRSAITTDATSHALAMSDFYQRIESSEKLTVSFTLGSLFAYVAAKMWLEKAGETLKSFLHTGIYTSAMGTSPASITYLTTSKKRPDFLVESSSGEWHLFESKGGNHASRFRRIVEGLRQLHGFPRVGWAATTPKAARTAVCVHTSVDAGAPLSVLAVDPPGIDGDDGAQGDRPKREDERPIELLMGVARLLVVLQTIEYFDALRQPDQREPSEQANQEEMLAFQTADAVDVDQASDSDDDFWLVREVMGRPGVAAAIPRHYKEHEDIIRGALAAYTAVRDVYDEQQAKSKSYQGGAFAQKVLNHLAASRDEQTIPSVYRPAAFLVARLAGVEPSADRCDFLQSCCSSMLIDEIERSFSYEWNPNSRPPRPFGYDVVRTTGGMLLGYIHEPERDL